MFCRKGVLKNFTNFTGKYLCWRLFLIKLHTCNFIKNGLQHRCFPGKFVKFSRTPTLKNICKLLLLYCSALFQYFLVFFSVRLKMKKWEHCRETRQETVPNFINIHSENTDDLFSFSKERHYFLITNVSRLNLRCLDLRLLTERVLIKLPFSVCQYAS